MKESKLYQEIMQEGELQRQRADLLKVVTGRFGEAFAAEVADPINALDDLSRLEQLFDATVLQGISREEFRVRLSAVAAAT